MNPCPRYPGTGPCRCKTEFSRDNRQSEWLFVEQPLISDRLMRNDGPGLDQPRLLPSVDTPGVIPLRWARPC